MGIVTNKDAKDALKRQFTDPVRLVELLGIRDFRREGGGVKILCPWHQEAAPDCSVTLGEDGTVRAHCFACGGGGDAFSLIAAVRGLDPKREFPKVLEIARELLGERGDEPTSPARPQPAAKPKTTPPIKEVEQLWASCQPVTVEPEPLRARGLDPAELEQLGLVKLLPQIAALPRWSFCRKRSWAQSGHRYLVPLYNDSGRMVSLRARAFGQVEVKALGPSGCSLAGCVMADAAGQQLLRSGVAPQGGVLIAEGEPDFWTLATQASDADAAPPAVLGIIAGGWNQSIADRIPDGTRVVIWMHTDRPKPPAPGKDARPGAGAAYAAMIRKTLGSRCDVRVVRQELPEGANKAPDANDLLRSGGRAAVQAVLDATADPAAPENAEPMTFLVGSESELATALLGDLRRGRRIVHDLGAFYAWTPTAPAIWQEVPQEELIQILRRFDGAPVLSSRDRRVNLSLNRAKGAIAIAAAEVRLTAADFFAGAVPGVAFDNGFVRLRSDGRPELLPHGHEHRQLHLLQVPYQPGAPAQRFLRFLGEVLEEEDPAETQAKHLVLQEFVGACLFGLATRFERCLFLTGTGNNSGGNGKSQFLKIVESLFPPDAVVHIEPRFFSDLRHRALFARARLNAVYEIEENELLDSSGLKALVSGDRLTAEPKYRDPFDFIPRCGHIINANTLPAVRDTTRGFWRRPLVIPFTRVFDTAPGRVVDIHKAILDAELTGVAAWAVAGAERLVRQNKYSEAASAEAAKAKWQTEANSVALYAESELERLPVTEHRLSSTVLYKAYKQWAQEGGYQAKSQISFSKALVQLGFVRHEFTQGTFFGAGFRSTQNWNGQ